MASHSPALVPRIAVEQLDLTAFRNYSKLRLSLTKTGQLIALSGPNGAGKTNLLEALSYLAPGRGLRSARLVDVAHRGETGTWAVAGIVRCVDVLHRIGTGLVKTLNEVGEDTDESEEADDPILPARRLVLLDGQKLRSSSALASNVSVLWLTPRMDRLFQEGSSERRRFFDQLTTGLFPEHATELSAYEKLVRQRMKLLLDGSSFDTTWLSALEGRIAAHAVALAARRREMLSLLVAHLPFTQKGSFPLPHLSLQGDLEKSLDISSALEAEENFARTMSEHRESDRRSQRTFVGPHRTDFLAVHPSKNLPANQCSSGEQKAMLIGILLAGARLQRSLKNRVPLLLLDEITAHLDETRCQILYQELKALGAQTWMSGNSKASFVALRGEAVHFSVIDGNVTPEPL